MCLKGSQQVSSTIRFKLLEVLALRALDSEHSLEKSSKVEEGLAHLTSAAASLMLAVPTCECFHSHRISCFKALLTYLPEGSEEHLKGLERICLHAGVDATACCQAPRPTALLCPTEAEKLTEGQRILSAQSSCEVLEEALELGQVLSSS